MSLIYPLFIPMAGCAARCIYCDQNKISGAPALDLEQARAGVAAFIRHHPEQDKQIAFYGGSFTRLSQAARESLLERILPLLDEHSSLRISTHPLWINPEILDWCGLNRIRTIELGIQDFDSSVLQKSGRGYSSEAAVRACKAVSAAGFELGIQLMPGLPGADSRSLQENFRRLDELRPQFLRLYPLIVIKGTILATAYSQGTYQALSLEAAIDICADYADLAEALNIRIIKLGIPSNISTADILAGPYHPAFGEFVRAELLIRKLVLDYLPDQPIFLNSKQASLLSAHGGRYRKILQDRLKNCTLDLIITGNHS